MAKTASGGTLPGWVLPVVILAGVIVLGFISWKAFSGSSAGAAGPTVDVKPGQYDLRKEIQAGHVGNRHRSDKP